MNSAECFTKLNDGHQMPLLGLGTWQSPKHSLFSTDGADATTTAVEAALNAGYRHIDTAYSYLNEEAVGEGIRRWIKNTGGKRSDLFITTKLPYIAQHPDRVERFLKMSLKGLGLEYVDLYLIHLPIGLRYINDSELYPTNSEGQCVLDYTTDHIGIWKQMVAMKEKGFAMSIGVSNFNVKQLKRLMALPMTPPAVNQVEMHVEFQQPAMRRYCTKVGVALTGFACLGSPGRKGTFAEKGTEIPNLFDNPIIKLVADYHKVDPAHILLKYFVQQGICVLPKSITLSRIVNNSKIFGWTLNDTEMKAIATLDRGEDGRTFRFLKMNGMEAHPECPAPVAE